MAYRPGAPRPGAARRLAAGPSALAQPRGPRAEAAAAPGDARWPLTGPGRRPPAPGPPGRRPHPSPPGSDRSPSDGPAHFRVVHRSAPSGPPRPPPLRPGPPAAAPTFRVSLRPGASKTPHPTQTAVKPPWG